MSAVEPLIGLEPGMRILAGNDGVLTVDAQLAAAFRPGDALFVVPAGGQILHIPRAARQIAGDAVSTAAAAIPALREASDEQLETFFGAFAAHLGDDELWHQVELENAHDVEQARARGRSTTRLETSKSMRDSMIEGLRAWQSARSMRGRVLETVEHDGWRAELIGAPLGVVAFVFEGRPNVVADATGVLRGGNAVVFRIGSDALGTAKKILELCTWPALRAANLPPGAVSIVDSAAHAAGWALFLDQRLSLAVARGSGPAVHTLGTLAQSAGIPVSLHGTGGAWLVVDESASAADVEACTLDSLDRKVCNTLNTCCILRSAAETLLPAFLRGLERAAARRGTSFRLHVAAGSQDALPPEVFTRMVSVVRATGVHQEPQADVIEQSALGHEWEWEGTPEVTLCLVDDLPEAIRLFNDQSPKFVACLLSQQAEQHQKFYESVDAPFVGDGFTRWVDGQYALRRPELGLSNWERGRLFGRGGILSGDSVYSVRTKVTGTSRGKPA
jgi:glutamate-5-semialdehyde dehydrogenase